MFMLVDSKEGTCMYVGLCFTYYEVVEQGFPPVRLTDQRWKVRLDTTPQPAPPEWTAGFRLHAAEKPALLRLPPPTPGR